MTTRLDIVEAARRRIVKDGVCPTCLSNLVEFAETPHVHCPRCFDVVYSPVTGEVLGPIL